MLGIRKIIRVYIKQNYYFISVNGEIYSGTWENNEVHGEGIVCLNNTNKRGYLLL